MLGALTQTLSDTTRLARYLARLMRDPRVPAGSKAKLLGTAAYVWVDSDLVSDALSLVPGLGYVDDVVLVVHGVTALVRDAGPELAAELWPGDAESFRRTMKAVVWLDGQLYGRLHRWVARLLRPGLNADRRPTTAEARG